MMSCIVGALLCGFQSAAIYIPGPVGYATQGGGAWGYAAIVQPIQYVPPVIIRRV